MLIHTKFLGEVEINESEIITFEHGLPGFQDNKQFILLSLDADLPLALLQSTEEAAVSFVVAFPFAFKPDYQFDLSEEDKNELDLESEADVLTYTVITLKETFQESTLNLLAPIVINSKKKLGKQVVLQDRSEYPLRFPIGNEIALEGSAK